MEDEPRLDPAEVTLLYAEHAEQLTNFLMGVLRDANLVQDVLQATFVKLIEKGGQSREETRKAWLFRVAYREACEHQRRGATGNRVPREKVEPRVVDEADAADHFVRFETVELVRQAMGELTEKQGEVVRLRVYEDLKFSEIAERLGLPLGTVLTRMRAAMEKLRTWLDDHRV
ncbi:MAG: RNA polymerase sigma factor [Planctomycetales bacterium]|nr:RNA polymerase sigma factor [Planctomycetales bacterium]